MVPISLHQDDIQQFSEDGIPSVTELTKLTKDPAVRLAALISLGTVSGRPSEWFNMTKEDVMHGMVPMGKHSNVPKGQASHLK